MRNSPAKAKEIGRLLRLRSLDLLPPVLLILFQACAPTGHYPYSSTETQRTGRGTESRASSSMENSLVSKITVGTPPQRAASLRLTEESRRLLDSGHYNRALTRLEKTLGVDSSNPYVYYYLAKAHFHLAQYRQSVEFLDVAESFLSSQPYWMGEVYSLKGKNFQALGLLERANSSYTAALRFNPKNQEASMGLNRVQREMKVPSIR